jgi:hypothetical protein
MSKGLNARYERQRQTNDSGGMISSVNLPSGVQHFRPREEGRNRILIIPYVIKSDKHPLVACGQMKVGWEDYVMDYWVHRSIGPAKKDFVCLALNYNKPCPICEYADEAKGEGRDKEYKATRASRKVIYNVVDERKKDKGVQVFYASHFLFEKELIDEATSDAGAGSSLVPFADIEKGKVITFRCGKGSMDTGTKFTNFKSFSFEDRPFKLKRKWLDDAVSFDECLTVLSYDELKLVLYGNADVDDDYEDDDEELYDDPAEEEERAPRSRRSRGRDRDEDDEDASDDAEDEEEEEDEEETSRRSRVRGREDRGSRNRKRSSRDSEERSSRRKSRRTVDEEDDYSEEDESDSASEKNECPAGYVFGEDNDTKKECAKCAVWDQCADRAEELENSRD